MIKLSVRRTEAGFNVAQTLPIRQLSKRQTEKLVPAGEALDFVIAAVALYTLAELVDGEEIHQLREA
jgi:hypothetical protein